MEQGQRVEVDRARIEALLGRLRPHLSDEDNDLLNGVLATLYALTHALEKATCSLKQLREMVFGPKSEKTKRVVGKVCGSKPAESNQSQGKGGESAGQQETQKQRPKGHGRNGAKDYTGATVQFIAHPLHKSKEPCPDCLRGKLYPMTATPFIHLTGHPPISAHLYEFERLRCNCCGKIFSASPPEGMPLEKYHPSAIVTVSLTKYSLGLPFNRLEGFQANLGVPLPSSTQWEMVDHMCRTAHPAYEVLCRRGANAELFHNDDTGARILSILKEIEECAARGEPLERTGTFTTGIVALAEGRRIVIFRTGRKHAGENLTDILKQRTVRTVPMQMCDGLDRNVPKECETILANCLVHGRRQFVNVSEAFPQEVKHLLDELATVYRNDADAEKNGLSPEERLRFHQEKSGPAMERLHAWLEDLLEGKQVEENSGLGKAIKYMLKRWERLTLFLRVPGAPLDNNCVERALKFAIRNRKNAMFYKTERGALVADVIMSLIATCAMNGVNAFHYLMALLQHPDQVARTPADWLPWNYQRALSTEDSSVPPQAPDRPT
jgi:transposase